MMDKEIIKTKQGVSGGVLCLIIVLCLLLGLTSGYIIRDKLSNNEEKIHSNINQKNEENNNTNKNEKTENEKNNVEEPEKNQIEKNTNNDASNEKKTYEVKITSDCKDNTKCIKSYDFSLNNKNHILKIYNISTSTFDHSSYFTIDDEKFELKEGFEFIDKFAIIDSNLLVISGIRASADYRSIIYIDSNLNKKTEIIGENYKDNQVLTSKTNIFTTCEAITCDNQIERKYSYTIADDGTATTKLIKEENKFCSAQC